MVILSPGFVGMGALLIQAVGCCLEFASRLPWFHTPGTPVAIAAPAGLPLL
jgi:hypothetical protein